MNAKEKKLLKEASELALKIQREQKAKAQRTQGELRVSDVDFINRWDDHADEMNRLKWNLSPEWHDTLDVVIKQFKDMIRVAATQREDR